MFSSAIHLVSYALHTVSRLFHLASDPCVSFHLSFLVFSVARTSELSVYLFLREGVSLLAFIHMSLFYYLPLYYLLSTPRSCFSSSLWVGLHSSISSCIYYCLSALGYFAVLRSSLLHFVHSGVPTTSASPGPNSLRA